MTKFLCSTIIFFFFFSVQGQSKIETAAYFDLIKQIVISEKLDSILVYRLDILKSKFIPSRSNINDYFNRDIEFGFKHHRIIMSLNFAGYQIDMLCKSDTILLSSISVIDYGSIKYDHFDKATIESFLKMRNKLYNSSKTSGQLIKEISLREEYAFYCGDGMPKTQKGKYIEELVEEENTETLIEMIKSFNCETQAYGIAGFEMLKKRDFEIAYDIQKIIDHIKSRNSELVICSGCLSGLVNKIYSKK